MVSNLDVNHKYVGIYIFDFIAQWYSSLLMYYCSLLISYLLSKTDWREGGKEVGIYFNRKQKLYVVMFSMMWRMYTILFLSIYT